MPLQKGSIDLREATRGLAFPWHAFVYLCCSQGGVKFPTGGIGRNPGARERFRSWPEGQQIRCDAGADGIVRMEENMQESPFAGEADHACSPKGNSGQPFGNAMAISIQTCRATGNNP